MRGSDPDRGGGEPDISELFCHYNALYFHDSLGTCAVSWATDEDPLPNRHKKRCSGSYHRVQGSSPGCVEGSKALSEEALDCKVEESAPGSWHNAHTSIKGGKGNKHDLEQTSARFPPDDSIGIAGMETSSRDTANKKIKLSKDIGLDRPTTTTVQEAPKRPRTTSLKKNQECSRQKKRKISKWDGSYSVIIEWLNYYSVDESDEDEVPLINKRSERRKRQKLLKIALARESNSGSEGASSTSFVENGRNSSSAGSYPLSQGDNEKSENVQANRVDGSSLPDHPHKAVQSVKLCDSSVSLRTSVSLEEQLRSDFLFG
uniref:Uncharacterized protein n=1 Tax=Oryza punctata TaxID=4537 RepID=A0A0E0KAL9_ORYPU